MYNFVFFNIIIGVGIFLPPFRALLKACMLPAPGSGPSEKAMNNGYLKVTGVAKGDKGGVATSVIYFPKDPGYLETARMLVESGRCLLQTTGEGGIHTPSSAFGSVIFDRLCETGSSFAISEGEKA